MQRMCIGGLAAAALTATLVGALGGGTQPAGTGPPKKPTWPECGTGPLPEIRDLEWMVGRWNVTVTWFAPPPSDKTFSAPTESVFEPILSGSFLQEKIVVPLGAMKNSMIGLRSFDRFRGVHRVVWLDEIATLADVYEGKVQDGALVVTNLKSGTAYVGTDGVDTFVRITYRAAGRDEFGLTWEASQDSGKTWRKTAEYRYARSK